MFPEAVPAARRAAKSKIKELKKAVGGLDDFRDIWTRDIQKLDFRIQPSYIEYLDDLITRLNEGYEKEIKKYTWQLTYLDNIRKTDTTDTEQPVHANSSVTELQIGRARSFPIPELIAIKRGTAVCIFHNDHKPSLKYYAKDNRVYCFACGKSADAIDVYMQLSGSDFKTAVRYLAP